MQGNTLLQLTEQALCARYWPAQADSARYGLQ